MSEEKNVLGLATIRHNRGITLKQIADTTKISVRSLEAIERGEFRKLPGGIYNTSYIRQYARAIDYDETALLAFYYRATEAENPESVRSGQRVLGALRPTSAILGS